ncbi:hypothetical protein [Caenibius sp. WL]|uniref:hypothetical protein n=1 Tax=Caenibius sp. WL TaxID=2872646 RepID=UPI001C991663|nr:hypothetical protein [Caenibius sp. WL]QZP07804.1 hypothetical protein K5X80_14295 [Caenibius sp. WL]QZP09964.1 hypothetical protein K5X80_16910 [Caenibius sp. WL]
MPDIMQTPEQIAEGLSERERRTMTDHQRMLWRDDVEGICPTPDSCFEYGVLVRCGPCAIQQARQFGIEPYQPAANLPEVNRLRRKLDAIREILITKEARRG